MQYTIVVLKEHMKNEGRVAFTPSACAQLHALGHKIFVERDAGEKSGYKERDYRSSGARIVFISEIIPFLQSSNTIVLKVKQPIPEDDVWFTQMRNGVLCTYFHSTGQSTRDTIDILLKNNITAISYELIEKDGVCPLLVPMSEIAGQLAVQWGAKSTSKNDQGLSMAILGAGTVGLSAMKEGVRRKFSSIKIFETDAEKARFVRQHLTREESNLVTFPLNFLINIVLPYIDLLVGAVLVRGGHAPMVISEKQVALLPKGSVIVDVSVDQGGCIWHPESETAPVFEFEGKTFFRVSNMPGSKPEESTPILAKAVFTHLLTPLVRDGAEDAFKKNAALRTGLLTYKGMVMNEKAAIHWGEVYTNPDTVFDGS